VDLNLLPARNPDDKTTHTFDYMMNGVGEFDRIYGWDDFDANRLTFEGHCRSEQEYLRWPNLLHIYPYITWGRTRTPKTDWDVSWSEDGRHLRMMVAGMPDEIRKACLGRAQLAHRGYDDRAFPRGHERLMSGVPKVLLRREGPSASFLVLYEPHSGRSAIKTWKRLDERACEVGLATGHTDLVLLRRKQVGHLWVRYYRNASCYDPPHVQTQADLLRKVFVARTQVLQLGELTLFESDKPLPALLLDCGDPAQRMLLLYVQADQPSTLKLALPQEPMVVDTFTSKLQHTFTEGKLTVQLPKGVSRLSLTFPRALFLTTKAGSINPAKLAQDLGLEDVKEATDDWKLNRSKLVLNLEYKRPRVYADGAYDGMKGVAPWTAAISEDGEFAVVGSHEDYVEALSPSGRLWRRYLQGKCLVDYNYASPGRNIIGRGHLGNPLAMNADGSRTFVGTDAGMLYCLDRDGHVLWEQKTQFRVQSVSISSDAAFIAVAADNRLFLFDAGGKPLLDRTLEQAIIDVLLTRDGKMLFYSAGDGTLECLDAAGKPQWKYQPALVDTGGATMYRHGMVFADLAVDAAANTLVGCHADYGVYAFDARTGNLRWRWGAESSQNNVAVSDDGKYIASSADGEVFYLDASGKLVWKFVGAFFGYNCLRMSRDGQYIAIVNPTGEWFLLSRDKRILTRAPVLTPEPMALGMTPDARRVVLAGIGYDVMLYDNVLD
jgi:outer membrane protein assembly factor BamB